jgi:DNA-binding NarL/FixJ family response regulator
VETVRVLLAEDVAILRKGLRAVLSVRPGIEVAGEAEDGLEAVRMACELLPHVVLMDLSMPRLDGVEAIARIKKLHPGMAVLALTGSDEQELKARTMAAGADGYLLKSVSPDDLARAVLEAARSKA